MIKKEKEKEKAIELRRKGYSYSEILKQVPVAKSSLSLWLKSVGLSKRQEQRLTEKKLAAMKRGWEARHRQKVEITEQIKKEAKEEIGKISKRDLWIAGIALYWGEGAKERRHGALARLDNSDPELIKLYLKWLLDVCGVAKKEIYFRISLHESAKDRLGEVKKYWLEVTGFPSGHFQKITWKKNKIKKKRRYNEIGYYGLLSVGVRRSVNFNRKIQGWIEGICK